MAVLTLLALRQRILVHPLIDLRLFRSPAFTTALLMYTVAVFSAFGAFFFVGQYLQSVQDFSPPRAGVWFLPSSLGFVIGAMGTPLLVRRAHPAYVAGAGLVLAAAGFGLLMLIDQDAPGLIVASLLLTSLGISPVVTLATDLIVGAAPPARAGAASAISETGGELGGALGVAVLGSIGVAVYRVQMADTVPAGVPAHAAALAGETLGDAVAAAEPLPTALGASLLDAAGQAFVQGMHLTAALTAAVMLATAVLVVAVLRHVNPATHAGEEAPDASPFLPHMARPAEAAIAD